MKFANAHTPILAVIAIAFTGCTTPQAALDQANNGSSLAMSLDAELQNFRTVQSNVAKARIDSIRRQTTMLATYEAGASFDERVLRAAGKDEALRLYTSLKDLADSRATDEQALNVKLAEMEDTFSKLLAPLPDLAQKLKTTQKALGVLGEELSAKERVDLVASFAKTIKKTIDDNKKKIEAAEAATPTAKSQPASVPGK